MAIQNFITWRDDPCRECPFKKTALPGYLGEVSFDPELFLSSAEDHPIPCHLTVNWEDDYNDPLKLAYSKPCIGLLQFFKQTCKLPIRHVYVDLVRSVTSNEQVFEKRQDFIDYHSG